MADDITPFQMSRISVRGGLGAGLLVAVLVAAMLADLPPLRGPALGALAVGLIFGLGRILWRGRKAAAVAADTPGTLSLNLDEAHRRRH